jgi:hypothetical protein
VFDYSALYHHNHHQITKLSHSINAIGPAPHQSGKKREHRSIMFATITHIPSGLWFVYSGLYTAYYGITPRISS